MRVNANSFVIERIVYQSGLFAGNKLSYFRKEKCITWYWMVYRVIGRTKKPATSCAFKKWLPKPHFKTTDIFMIRKLASELFCHSHSQEMAVFRKLLPLLLATEQTAPTIIWISNMEIQYHDMYKMSGWELGFLLNMSWKTQRLPQLCLHLEVTKVQSQQKSWLPNLMQMYPIHQT